MRYLHTSYTIFVKKQFLINVILTRRKSLALDPHQNLKMQERKKINKRWET
jgi:hypothetical protein